MAKRTDEEAKQPYIPLYTGDYLKDTRRLTLEVRGAWVDLLIFMWESSEKGVLIGTLEEYALMIGCTYKKADKIIGELMDKRVCDFELLGDGKIKLTSRRIIKDLKKKEAKRAAGLQGGNPLLLKQTDNQKPKTDKANSDNDIDNENHLDKKEPSLQIPDSYTDGAEAFEDIKNNPRLVENIIRIARRSGYVTYTEVQVMGAVKHFIILEAAKPEFSNRPRDDIKKHLVNWINVNAKKINDYARV